MRCLILYTQCDLEVVCGGDSEKNKGHEDKVLASVKLTSMEYSLKFNLLHIVSALRCMRSPYFPCEGSALIRLKIVLSVHKILFLPLRFSISKLKVI